MIQLHLVCVKHHLPYPLHLLHHVVYNLPDSSSTCLKWPGLSKSFKRSKHGHISQVPPYLLP